MGYIDVPVMKGRKWYSFKNYLIRPLITGTLILVLQKIVIVLVLISKMSAISC